MSDKFFARDVGMVGDIIAAVPVEDDADNPYDAARRVLRSQWLADRDQLMKQQARDATIAQVKAELDEAHRSEESLYEIVAKMGFTGRGLSKGSAILDALSALARSRNLPALADHDRRIKAEALGQAIDIADRHRVEHQREFGCFGQGYPTPESMVASNIADELTNLLVASQKDVPNE